MAIDTHTLFELRIRAMQLAIDAWKAGANEGLNIEQLAEKIYNFLAK